MNRSRVKAGQAGLNSSQFEGLLLHLDRDRERAGAEYERIRRDLMRFFKGSRCYPAEELADDTMDRVARRLECTQIRNLSAYIRGTARIIVLEVCRQPREVGLEDLPLNEYPKAENAEWSMIHGEERQLRMECLKKCLLELSPVDREVFFRYQLCTSRGKGKAQLAHRLGFTEQVLRIRAHRVRRKLEISAMKYRRSHQQARRTPGGITGENQPASSRYAEFVTL
jgi:DNA-directed RNA polymerase specialized sigma24 family protein